MKSVLNNVLVALAFLLFRAFQIDAQEHSLTDEERQTKRDSIIAETERHFGWNDDAYSVKTAKEKWLSGDAKMLLQDGIAPVVYIGQEKFAKRYGIGYHDFGCIANCSDTQMAKYNTAIMDCLTVKFGKGWQDSIRKDVPGLDKYGVSVFKNIQYEGNGTGMVVLPVIYKALGRSASDPEESGFVLDIINCVSPTSMEFLYRGVEYYIPLSCNAESGETPLENELIEITIRVFNPKVFRYSKNIKPSPFCVIETINLLR
ncbi:hypothetical protein [Muribaculum intestinale]|uniref:FEKKY domain-containing protein n=1 Tax=Muribaculum intestinale TaxID=1796646 RepID=UPI0025A9FFB5|nr:hypothetical protein [Muribaculum intestinale]